jgi:hypothetical protein
MLGNLIYEGQGKIENRIILDTNDGNPTLEVTNMQTDTVKDIEPISLVTYSSIPQIDGTQYAEGQGIISAYD